MYPIFCHDDFVFIKWSVGSRCQPTPLSLFDRLPQELRVNIWELALSEQHKKRLVLLYMHEGLVHMAPFKGLVIPLMSINRESRAIAQYFYPCKIPIYLRSLFVS